MGEPEELRPFLAEDAQRVSELARQLRAEFGQPVPPIVTDSILRDVMGSPARIRVHVAVRAGHIFGYVSYQDFYEPSSGKHGIHLCDVYVEQEERRRGTGARLIQMVSAEAASRGKEFVWWLADQSNDAAHRFYEALGARSVLARSYVISLPQPGAPADKV